MTKPDAAAIREMLASGAWKIVPVEPTEEMLRKARSVTAVWHDLPGSALTVNLEKMRLRWRAMLSVSPAAPDITELAEENARLRKALEPFAEAAKQYGDLLDENFVCKLGARVIIRAGTLNDAKAALSPQEGRG